MSASKALGLVDAGRGFFRGRPGVFARPAIDLMT
jgi:hypothetical protein